MLPVEDCGGVWAMPTLETRAADNPGNIKARMVRLL